MFGDFIIYLFMQQLLIACLYMLGIVGPEDTALNKKGDNPCSCGFYSLTSLSGHLLNNWFPCKWNGILHTFPNMYGSASRHYQS